MEDVSRIAIYAGGAAAGAYGLHLLRQIRSELRSLNSQARRRAAEHEPPRQGAPIRGHVGVARPVRPA
jgi:hypothetical protein